MPHATTLIPRDLARLLRAEVAQVRRLLPAGLRGSVTGVHRARVASRRLRALVPVVGAGREADVREARRWLRKLTRKLGHVRELDVTRALLRSEAGEGHWPAVLVARVDRGLVRERVERRAALHARLGANQHAAPLDALDAIAGAIETTADLTPAAAALASRVHRRARALAAAIDAAGTLYEPDAIHRVRIAGKKLRYTLEIAHGAARVPSGASVRRLKTLQDLLGGMHDRQVLQHRLQALMASGGLDRASVVRLEGWVARLERECRDRHARFLRRAAGLRALAQAAAVEVPLALVPARPGRMRGAPRRADRVSEGGLQG